MMRLKETVSIILTALFTLAYLIGFGSLTGYLILILAALMVAFSYNAARLHIRRFPGSDLKIMKRLLIFYFVIFLHMLFSFTLGSTYFYRPSSFAFSDPEAFKIYLQHRTNFIPFLTIRDAFGEAFVAYGTMYAVVNVGGNILALMPMGLFLPALFRRQRRFPIFFVTVTLVVIMIESLQMLFLMGACDIDDLILNDLGAVLMFFIMKIPFVVTVVDKVFPGVGAEITKST